MRSQAQVRERLAKSSNSLCLISSPGYAVLDSGCGRSVIGAETLAQFQSLWRQAGIGPAAEVPEQNSFRFGSPAPGCGDASVPGRQARLVRAAVIKGKAPLLTSLEEATCAGGFRQRRDGPLPGGCPNSSAGE